MIFHHDEFFNCPTMPARSRCRVHNWHGKWTIVLFSGNWQNQERSWNPKKGILEYFTCWLYSYADQGLKSLITVDAPSTLGSLKEGSQRFPLLGSPLSAKPSQSTYTAVINSKRLSSQSKTYTDMAKITLFLPILSFLVFIAESTLTPSKFQCSNSSYQIAFGPNATSPYKANLELVLSSLSSYSRVQGGYYNSTSGNSTDVVYGCFLCRGDLSADACEGCVQNLTKTILQLCPKSKWAILWYDQCMVRYSDHNFFSSMEKEPYLYGYNEENSVGPNKFMAALGTTMRKLEKLLGDKYGRAEKKYATMEAQIEVKERLYTMAECTPDMNVTGCRTCLEIASSRLQTIEKGKIGGRVMLPNCFMRFEIYSFYGIDWKGNWIRETDISNKNIITVMDVPMMS